MKQKNIHTILAIQALIAAFLLCMSISTVQAKIVVIENNEDQFNQEVNTQPCAVVAFSAGWCGVCKSIQKPLEDITGEQEFNKITFVQVDIEKHKNLSKKNGIIGVPTFLYLENGRKIKQEIGIHNMYKFKKEMRNNLRSNFKIAQNTVQSDVPLTIVTPHEKTGLFTLDVQAENYIPEKLDRALLQSQAQQASSKSNLEQLEQSEQHSCVPTKTTLWTIRESIKAFIIWFLSMLKNIVKSIIDALKSIVS